MSSTAPADSDEEPEPSASQQHLAPTLEGDEAAEAADDDAGREEEPAAAEDGDADEDDEEDAAHEQVDDAAGGGAKPKGARHSRGISLDIAPSPMVRFLSVQPKTVRAAPAATCRGLRSAEQAGAQSSKMGSRRGGDDEDDDAPTIQRYATVSSAGVTAGHSLLKHYNLNSTNILELPGTGPPAHRVASEQFKGRSLRMKPMQGACAQRRGRRAH